MWYEDISPEQLADVLSITPNDLFDKLFGNVEFTPEEIRQIVVILGLTKEETDAVFGKEE
jgi:hypothetical protein